MISINEFYEETYEYAEENFHLDTFVDTKERIHSSLIAIHKFLNSLRESDVHPVIWDKISDLWFDKEFPNRNALVKLKLENGSMWIIERNETMDEDGRIIPGLILNKTLV